MTQPNHYFERLSLNIGGEYKKQVKPNLHIFYFRFNYIFDSYVF